MSDNVILGSMWLQNFEMYFHNDYSHQDPIYSFAMLQVADTAMVGTSFNSDHPA